MNTIKNNVTLMGHLGADPEYKKLDSGKALLKLRLATNEVYKNKEGERTSTTHWHNCVAWGKQADLMKDLLKKGKEVIIQGKLQYRTYKDSNGVEKKISEVVVNEFSLTGKKDDT